jgi:hypothetical protein
LWLAITATRAPSKRLRKEEGLNSTAAFRARRNETNSKVHELFSRCAQSLIFAAPAIGAQGDRVLGFPLELVAKKNPYAIRAGEDLPVRPLAGALVIAMNRQIHPRNSPPEQVTTAVCDYLCGRTECGW